MVATKYCRSCDTVKTVEDFYWNSTRNIHYSVCRTCKNSKSVKWAKQNSGSVLTYKRSYDDRHYRENVGKYLLKNAQSRAKKHGLPIDITEDDIVVPDFCPVLGVPLERGKRVFSQNSPTLDRIVPELGYVKGNIEVISFRANTIKNNATPEELMRVAQYYNKSS